VSSRTVSVTIQCAPDKVAAFVGTPEYLSAWAHGLGSGIVKSGDAWVADTAQGRATIRFIEPNQLGVLDHYVRFENGTEVHVPMRVLPNGAGSELIFTILPTDGMSDQQLAEDAAAVQRDFARLKTLLEAAG
jgi:hypothetical protein